jgi:ADP-dependent NAD(P)H-hydrate dehydratase / NAD(P)H-hydrate epimerase
MKTLKLNESLPEELYLAGQVRELDRTAIEDFEIPGLTLMERAGSASYRLLRDKWPEARDITIICGTGNNGGDGFVVARLALQDGIAVRVLQLGNPEKLSADARHNSDAFLAQGGEVIPFELVPEQTEVIVDGVFGTGLEREVTGTWAEAIEAINEHWAPVLALDIPSGLHSDSGRILGTAVKADATISFIGLKQGIFTGDGPEQCGELHFNDLEVPSGVYSGQRPSASRVSWSTMSGHVMPRSRTAHKGDFGHLLVIGGAPGYSGAVRMAAEAAARSGVGLVSVATSPEHAALLNLVRPELMCHGVDGPQQLLPLLKKVDLVAIGPGLGQSDWSLGLLGRVLDSSLPLVLDADALNLLAFDPTQRDNWILTPHPGEAARLLGCTTSEIQADRFQSVRRLQQRFGGVAVLKGAGTLIQAGQQRATSICTDGNPGMATGGMGDVLTGVIAALLAQGHAPELAASMGVCIHAAAADMAAGQGERGLLAGDLMPLIRGLINPEMGRC